MVLAMTHEEVVADLLRDIVRSYRQLPFIVYHFQTKFRDEPRVPRRPHPRARVRDEGLVHAATATRPASTSATGRTTRAYTRIFERLGLDAIAVSSDVGMMGGIAGPRVHGPQPRRRGRRSSSARRATTPRTGRSRRPSRREPAAEDLLPVEEVETPDATTIEALATFLGVPAVADREGRVLRDRRRPVRRRDRPRRLRRQRDEARERASRRSAGLRPATGRGDHGARHGAGLRLADRRARRASSSSTSWPRGAPNLVAGREPGRLAPPQRQRAPRLHARRRSPTSRTSARATRAPTAAAPVILRNGIEVGNIFKLGTKYTDALGAEYLGEDGERHPIVMGSYGIGLGRNVAVHRRGAPRREGHRLARGGRAVPRAPRRDRRATRIPQVLEIAERLHDLARGGRAATARSCTTTATSRPA